jgi:hypothetical protein
MRVTVVVLFAVLGGAYLNDLTKFRQKSEISVNRSKADIWQDLADTCEDHFRRWVIVSPLEIGKDRIALFGMLHKKITVLSEVELRNHS